MNAQQFLADLHQRGIHLSVGADGRVELEAHEGIVTKADATIAMQHKHEILALLDQAQSQELQHRQLGGVGALGVLENKDGALETKTPAELAALEMELVDLSVVKPKPVTWLWRGYLVLGALNIIDGDPGRGKSVMMGADIAARVTTNSPMPDGTSSDLGGPAGVVLLSLQDNTANTIVPRLIAAGADLSRTRQLKTVGKDKALPTLEDLDAIRFAVQEVGAKLAVLRKTGLHEGVRLRPRALRRW